MIKIIIVQSVIYIPFYFLLSNTFIVSLSYLVIIIGEIMNYIAMRRNGGKMPVYKPEWPIMYYNLDEKHFAFRERKHIRLFFLTDRFKFSCLNNKTKIISIGDILLIIGIIILLVDSTVENSLFFIVLFFWLLLLFIS